MGDVSTAVDALKLDEPLFKGVKFYISGHAEDQILELLRSGGAERMNYFSDYVTHLVCGDQPEETDLTDAYDVYEIPAVHYRWVELCSKLGRRISTKGFRPDPSQLFSGMTFCLSKVKDDVNALWSLVTYNGGVVRRVLDAKCTHLVTVKTSGTIYGKAASMIDLIKIVTPDWIIESVRNKTLCQYELYHPKLLTWPKPVIHSSTSLITGFEPEPEQPPDASESEQATTQALLEQLKQRMPWNQPTPAATTSAGVTTSAVPLVKTVTPTNQMPSGQHDISQRPMVRTQNQRPLPRFSSPGQAQPQLPTSVAQFTTQSFEQHVDAQREHVEQQQDNVTKEQSAQKPQMHVSQQLHLAQQQQQQVTQQLGQPQLPQHSQPVPVQAQMAQSLGQQPQMSIQNQINQQPQIGQTPQVTQQVQMNHQRPVMQPQQIGQPQLAQQQAQLNQLRQEQMQQKLQYQSQMINQNQAQLRNVQMGQVQLNQVQLRQLQLQQQQQQPQLGQHQQVLGQQGQIAKPLNQQLVQNQHGIMGQQARLGQAQLTQNQQMGQAQQQVQNHMQPQINQQNQLAQQMQINQQQVHLGQQHMQNRMGPQAQMIKAQTLLAHQQNQMGHIESPQMQMQQQQMPQVQMSQQNQMEQSQPMQSHLGQQQQPQQQIRHHALVQNHMQMAQAQPVMSQHQPQAQFSQALPFNSPQPSRPQSVVPTQQFVSQTNLVQQAFVPDQNQAQLQTQTLPTQTAQYVQNQQIPNQIAPNQTAMGPHQAQLPLVSQSQLVQAQGQVVGQQFVPQQAQQRAVNPQLHPNWQQQQQQQGLGVRHPVAALPQGARLNWSPNQQNAPAVPHRQFIQLDAQTHQQLQQMDPQQRALFVQKLQHKQRQLIMQRHLIQQQRGGHIVAIRGAPVAPGLNPQQQMQWLQQQAAKPQAVVMQQQQQPGVQHAPGLSPIVQPSQPAFTEQQLQLQNMQRQQYQQKLQQLQLQREQAQKQQGAVARSPLAQPQPASEPPPVPPTDQAGPTAQQQLVVNAKTKTALANMLSIRLQGGSTPIPTGPEGEPSAAGTLRLMTAQHNAALNATPVRPQELLAMQQRRTLGNITNGEIARPQPPPSAPPAAQPVEQAKLQFSPNRALPPPQHRPGPFYGHNPNLKLPPELFLLGCIFVVVEVEHILEEAHPEWVSLIEKHGGEVESSYCNRVTHVLCETQRHGVVMQALRDCKRCVTVFWLQDTLRKKQVAPPWHPLHVPTMYIDGTPASKHLISISRFEGDDRLKVKNMVQYIGAKYTDYFSRHNTVLVCGKAEGNKHVHAKKWGTPVVNVLWLTDLMLGNFAALNQMEHMKYQQFSDPIVYNFDPAMVPTIMQGWKMPINISQESYERVKRNASPVTIPKKAKKPRLELQASEEETPASEPSPTHRILLSSVPERERLQKIVIRLGGSLAKSHEDATHLVMTVLSRTVKLLLCISKEVRIVTDAWLIESSMANKFLDESQYGFDVDKFNAAFCCDLNKTLSTRNRGRLLDGKTFYITPSVYPSYHFLKQLIECSGGRVEKDRRTLPQIEAANAAVPFSYIIITHEHDLHLIYDCLKHFKGDRRVVCTSEVVLAAVTSQTFEAERFAVTVT